MTDYTEFTPNRFVPFSFSATFNDGSPILQSLRITTTWNVYSQRWYVNAVDSSGKLVFAMPLIGSSSSSPIDSITWLLNNVTVIMSEPHNYKIGTVKRLTIAGCVPDGYNGIHDCYIISPVAFNFALLNNPGLATTIGVARYDISMAQPYFNSTLVFRTDNNNFEVDTLNILPVARAPIATLDLEAFLAPPPPPPLAPPPPPVPGKITGTLHVAMAAQVLSATGVSVQPSITGTLASTQAAHALVAAGVVAAAGTINGALALTQAAQTLTSAGNTRITGTLAITQDTHTISSAGWTTARGTLVVAQAPQTLVGGSNVSTSSGLLPAGFLSVHTGADGVSRIVNASNNSPVWVRGVNWDSMELGRGYASGGVQVITGGGCPAGLWANNYKNIISLALNTGFNCLFINYSDDVFDNPVDIVGDPSASSPTGTMQFGILLSANPDLSRGITAYQLLDKIVAYCGTIGMKIFFRRMWQMSTPTANGYFADSFTRGQTNLWFDLQSLGGNATIYNDAKVISNLNALAGRYAGNPTVIGIEVNNEIEFGAAVGPSANACDWGTTAGHADSVHDVSSWYVRAENTIHSANPDILVCCEFPQAYYADTAVPPTTAHYGGGDGTAMRTAAYRPTFNFPNKVCFSVHSYGPSVDATVIPQQPSTYDAEAFFIMQPASVLSGGLGQYPVLFTEFGIQHNPGDGSNNWAADIAWLTDPTNGLVNYIAKNQIGYAYFYWGGADLGGQDPAGMLDNSYSVVSAELKGYIQPLLFSPNIVGSLTETQAAQTIVGPSGGGTQTATVGSGHITDNSGNIYAINTSHVVTYNGTNIPGAGNTDIIFWNGTDNLLYTHNEATATPPNTWYSYTGGLAGTFVQLSGNPPGYGGGGGGGGTGTPVVAPLTGTVTTGTWVSGDISVGGVTLPSGKQFHYYYLLPAQYNAAFIYPLLIHEHTDHGGDAWYLGTGDPGPGNADGYYNNVGWRTAYPCIVVVPLADQTSGGASANSAVYNFGGWSNSGVTGGPTVSSGDTGPNVFAVAGLTQYFINNFPVNANKVYITGDSLGGIGSWYMMYRYNTVNGPDGKIFTAGVPMAGVMEINGSGVGPSSANITQFQTVPVFAVSGALDTTSNVADWNEPMWRAYAGNSSYPPAPGAKAGSSTYYYLEDPAQGHSGAYGVYRVLPAGKPIYDWLFSQSSGATSPPPPPTTIFITPGSGSFTTTAGPGTNGTYTITSGSVFAFNGTAIPGGSGTDQAALDNTPTIWARDHSTGQWYYYSGGASGTFTSAGSNVPH